MLYLIGFLFPPLAVLLANRPIQALINFVMLVIGLVVWPLLLVCVLHAILVVSSRNADKRQERLIREMSRAQAQALGHAEGLRQRQMPPPYVVPAPAPPMGPPPGPNPFAR
jgi:Na+/H+-dicarboxylate symporter